jgi:hypothetical protein
MIERRIAIRPTPRGSNSWDIFLEIGPTPPGPKRWSNLIGPCHPESVHTAWAKSSTFVFSPPRAEARFVNFTSRIVSGMPAA